MMARSYTNPSFTILTYAYARLASFGPFSEFMREQTLMISRRTQKAGQLWDGLDSKSDYIPAFISSRQSGYSGLDIEFDTMLGE